MYRILKRSRLALLLCFVLLFSSLAPAASALSPVPLVNNVIIGSGNSTSGPSNSAKSPSASDIRATSNGDRVTYPNSYFSSYYPYYVDAPKGHSIYVYHSPDVNAAYPRTAFHGSRVIGIASQGVMTCILYYTDQYEYRCGWVETKMLSYAFPGRTVSIGTPASNLSFYGDAVLSWSNEPIVAHPEKYVLLQQPVSDVAAFTLDYQLIGRTGAERQDCIGPRYIYVNDGSGWVNVGSFSYNDFDAVHVNIALSTPMKIAAVAVTADCAKPEAVSFRLAVLDIYTK